ncbi:hypothetical protein [Pilimelia columellifera]|uniref:DUF8175 domain-containing protein n=1 Tax=Pilimelia columellifera subsp. columellifera TaxID=706583 RepID=A0ABN3NI82_9ACTN
MNGEDNTFLAGPRHSRRIITIAAGLLVVLAVGVLLVVRAKDTAPQEPSPQANPSASPAPEASPTGGSKTPLRLVHGKRTRNGIAVGYPHSAAGAVSAAIEYWAQLGSTLDPDRARKIGDTIAADDFEDAGDYLARGPSNSRRKLGLPTSGPLPEGSTMTLSPAAYQLRDQSDDHMTVLLLSYLTTTTPSSGVLNRVGVFPIELAWQGDWRMRRPSGNDGDYLSLSRTPGSAEATAAGWQDFTQ